MLNNARRYAAQEIAHRWFAYFEGVTEPLSEHLDLFTADVRLLHAGRTLLADGKPQLAAWLQQVLPETSSHFISDFSLQSLDESSALLTMQVAYQALADDRLIGSLIDYQAKVVFAADDSAQFSVIQKTPVAANPALSFAASFAENRQQALLAQFSYQCQRGALHWQRLVQDDAMVAQLTARFSQLEQQALAALSAQFNQQQQLQIQQVNGEILCRLTVTDTGGRYPQIVAIADE